MMTREDRFYPNGQLIELRDDITRTVTTYDETGAVTSTRPYTEAESAAADADLADVARLDDLAARVARIEAHLWPAPDDPTTPDDPTVADWAALGGAAAADLAQPTWLTVALAVFAFVASGLGLTAATNTPVSDDDH